MDEFTTVVPSLRLDDNQHEPIGVICNAFRNSATTLLPDTPHDSPAEGRDRGRAAGVGDGGGGAVGPRGDGRGQARVPRSPDPGPELRRAETRPLPPRRGGEADLGRGQVGRHGVRLEGRGRSARSVVTVVTRAGAGRPTSRTHRHRIVTPGIPTATAHAAPGSGASLVCRVTMVTIPRGSRPPFRGRVTTAVTISTGWSARPSSPSPRDAIGREGTNDHPRPDQGPPPGQGARLGAPPAQQADPLPRRPTPAMLGVYAEGTGR